MTKETEIVQSLKQISANLETINSTIKEVKKEDAKKMDDRTFQSEMAKIQIYSDFCHVRVTSLLGFIVAYFIGSIAIFSGVLYQAINATNPLSISISVNTWYYGLATTVIVTLVIGFITFCIYRNDIKTISKMIEDVKGGKELKPLERIRQEDKPEKR